MNARYKHFKTSAGDLLRYDRMLDTFEWLDHQAYWWKNCQVEEIDYVKLAIPVEETTL